MAVYQHVLLAVDLTAESRVIGRRARALADAVNAELKIIHVVEPVPAFAPIPPNPVGGVAVTAQTTLIESAQGYIGRLAHELGVPATHWSIAVGDTKGEIIRVAIDQKADLIVIGSHGRHALAFLIKPTEDVVVHRAPCDVLAVRLPEQPQH